MHSITTRATYRQQEERRGIIELLPLRNDVNKKSKNNLGRGRVAGATLSLYVTLGRPCHPKFAHSRVWAARPHVIHGTLGTPTRHSERHLDRISRLCRINGRYTNGQTD